MIDNKIVCPHCNTLFSYNRVNGLALVEVAQSIEARKRMYSKLTLDAFERLDKSKELTFTAARKIVLDNMNDLARDIHTILGFGTEAE